METVAHCRQYEINGSLKGEIAVVGKLRLGENWTQAISLEQSLAHTCTCTCLCLALEHRSTPGFRLLQNLANLKPRFSKHLTSDLA